MSLTFSGRIMQILRVRALLRQDSGRVLGLVQYKDTLRSCTAKIYLYLATYLLGPVSLVNNFGSSKTLDISISGVDKELSS